MASTAQVMGMLRTDGIRLRRDRFLIGTALYIVAIAIVVRWALPWASSEVAARFGFDLTPYYPLIVSHFVIQLAGLLAGILGGFLLLESREDGTLKALLVSPVPLSAYVAVLSAAMVALSVALTLVEGAIIALGLPPWPALIGAAVAGAPAAPGLALFIAAVADNKTEAFAYMKICSLGPVLASGVWFLSEPWQWAAAVYPPYWASKAYWMAETGSGSWPFWMVGGLIVSALWLVVLLRSFSKAARR